MLQLQHIKVRTLGSGKGVLVLCPLHAFQTGGTSGIPPLHALGKEEHNVVACGLKEFENATRNEKCPDYGYPDAMEQGNCPGTDAPG